MTGNYEAAFLNTPNHTIYSNPMGVSMKGVEYSGTIALESLRKQHSE